MFRSKNGKAGRLEIGVTEKVGWKRSKRVQYTSKDDGKQAGNEAQRRKPIGSSNRLSRSCD